ncbi:MAG TPA: hypothetical protein VJU84_11035 [Pyrinomonadaceae bacterium]|nr:hypothetical protein [Pyrinomonadaceae bacterium]
MKLKLAINGTKELKKRTYLVLKQMQHLESGKKVDAIYARYVGTNHQDLYVLRCLDHLKSLIAYACANINDPGVIKRSNKLQAEIGRVSREVQRQTSSQQKVLRRARIGDLLRSHTSLFNFLLERQYAAEIDIQNWINVTNSAIAVWGDHIAPRSRAKASRA